MNNMELWDRVCQTDPNHTKPANVGGNKITCIAPQYQIMNATNEFGSYGSKWGFSSIDIDYTLMSLGIIVFYGVFFHPKGSFPIINSCKLYKDNAKLKIDDDFAKKIETDALTKALSKLGFNADVFMGKFDDCRYVDEMVTIFANKSNPDLLKINQLISSNDAEGVRKFWDSVIADNWSLLTTQQTTDLNNMFNQGVTK
tara:strand:- start:1520 stop:2116 length:597 start_codon:yes stop_codon:yes gene_type:complete